MKTKIGIFGGDDRHCYLANELILRGHEVWVWELGNERDACPILSQFQKVKSAKTFSELAENCQVLAGPVPFSKYLAAKEKEKRKEAFPNTLCANVRAGQHFFAGGIPRELKSALEEKGVLVTDYLTQNDFLARNAELTAQGCVAEVVRAYKKRLRHAKVLVTGFGFCGREIAGVMRGMGAEVTVCVRRMQSAWEAYEAGFSIGYYEQLNGLLMGMDIVINTVPAQVFPENRLKSAKAGTLFVEIASAPGGFSPEVAENLGLRVVLCPGLPGKYVPAGAAEAMADCMLANVKAMEKEGAGEIKKYPGKSGENR